MKRRLDYRKIMLFVMWCWVEDENHDDDDDDDDDDNNNNVDEWNKDSMMTNEQG